MRAHMDPAKLWMLSGTAAYVSAVAHAGSRLRRRQPPRAVWTFPLLTVGFVTQGIGLHLRGLSHMACPILNPFEMLQFISFSLILIFLCTGTVFRMSVFGGFSAALAAALSLGAFLYPRWDTFPQKNNVFGGNPWIEAHASLAVFSYGAFALLAVSATLYLLQEASLREKRDASLFRLLPSLVQLETVGTRLLILATSCFSISLLMGSWAYVQALEGVTAFKLIITLPLWIGCCLILGLRLMRRIRGRTFAWACIALFATALFALWPVEGSRHAAPPAIQPDPYAVPTHGA